VIDMGVMVPCDKILARAKEEGADIIGLSGLITPSLDEMMHVASEMERTGVTTPLLIGGATTSAAHTAIKIAPKYSGSIVHVLDASRSVPVVTSLLSQGGRDEFVAKNEARHVEMVEKFGGGPKKKLISLVEAQEKKFACDWSSVDVATPGDEWGGVVLPEIEDLVPFIDWSPFFHTWELRGRYPAIFEDAEVGEEAKKVFDDAQAMLKTIVAEKRFTAKGVWGLFPANAIGDDVEVYADSSRSEVKTKFHTLRQQMPKKGKPNYALADFVAPKDSGREDHIGGFVVCIHGGDEYAKEFEKDHDDYSGIMAKALADRLAEAFAEKLHHDVRVAWGYEQPNELNHEDYIRERYRGIRPAGGYPAQPDHTEKRALFDLLEAEKHTGASLTESMAMHPGAAVSGLYFSHPESRYFGVGQIAKDQVEDYAARKGISVDEAEKWLGPWLGY
jgi:5-methyltetrahydrofolate--homocysteine methyltransferase